MLPTLRGRRQRRVPTGVQLTEPSDCRVRAPVIGGTNIQNPATAEFTHLQHQDQQSQVDIRRLDKPKGLYAVGDHGVTEVTFNSTPTIFFYLNKPNG